MMGRSTSCSTDGSGPSEKGQKSKKQSLLYTIKFNGLKGEGGNLCSASGSLISTICTFFEESIYLVTTSQIVEKENV